MEFDDWRRQSGVLRNPHAPLGRRMLAAESLGRQHDAPLLTELTAIAEDPDADPELHRAVGRAIARVVMARDGVDDTLFLGNFAGPAFIAFDEEVAVIAAEQDGSRTARGLPERTGQSREEDDRQDGDESASATT